MVQGGISSLTAHLLCEAIPVVFETPRFGGPCGPLNAGCPTAWEFEFKQVAPGIPVPSWMAKAGVAGTVSAAATIAPVISFFIAHLRGWLPLRSVLPRGGRKETSPTPTARRLRGPLPCSGRGELRPAFPRGRSRPVRLVPIPRRHWLR